MFELRSRYVISPPSNEFCVHRQMSELTTN